MAKRTQTMPVLDGGFERSRLEALRLPESCLVAGIDEAGRGPLAGPVVAAAVMLDPAAIPDGLADSKMLTPPRREALFDVVLAQARCIGLGVASAAEIDALNIRRATHLAMARAVSGLAAAPGLLLIDGNDRAGLAGAGPWRCEAVVKGDAKAASIAAASIIAKVMRDRMMARIDAAFPVYGFARHQGYGAPQHLAAIASQGPCPLHRFSFAPMKPR